MDSIILPILLKTVLLGSVTLLISCASPSGGNSKQVPAAVKARLRQPVPVVFVGLQDQVCFQKPAGSRDVIERSWGDTQQIGSELGPIVAATPPEAAFIYAPFLAAALVVPPLTCLVTAGATVNPKKAEAAAIKLRRRFPQKDWGSLLRRAVTHAWAAHGSSFSEVTTFSSAMFRLGADPLEHDILAKSGSRTLLSLHVAGPGLTAEGDKLDPRIAPSLMIYWKAIDTTKGTTLAHGTIAERSTKAKTLLAWARGNDDGLQTELENVVLRAAARLTENLR